MCKVRVNLTEGEFEIQGDPSFIEQIIPGLKDYVATKKVFVQQPENSQLMELPVAEPSNSEGSNSNSDDAYHDFRDVEYVKQFVDSGVVYIEEDKLNIAFDIPGNSNADVTRNAILLMAYFKDNVTRLEIINVLKNQGRYDKSNFLRYVNELRGKVIKHDGNKDQLSFTITRPGEKECQTILVKILKNENKGEIDLFEDQD